MTAKLNEDNVAAYLAAHPDFFAEHSDLLLGLRIPHETKGTVSLVEKQVDTMRERQKSTRQQLTDFVDSAERNKEIFDKSRRLILNLVAANRPGEFFDALEKGLRKDFGCKAYSLIVFGSRPRQINHFTSRVTAESAREYIGALMRARQPTLGVLRSDEQDFLFRHQSEKVKSAAVLAVRDRNRQQAILAFGSPDAHYFSPEMDTLFIGFIADIMSKLLPRHLPR